MSMVESFQKVGSFSFVFGRGNQALIKSGTKLREIHAMVMPVRLFQPRVGRHKVPVLLSDPNPQLVSRLDASIQQVGGPGAPTLCSCV